LKSMPLSPPLVNVKYGLPGAVAEGAMGSIAAGR